MASLGIELGRLRYRLKYLFFWLGVRKDTPKRWFFGSYSPIKLVRFSLVTFALLNFSGVALGSPDWSAATPYGLWLGFASAIYILVAIIYLFGLRMWYGQASALMILGAVVNYMFDSAGGPDALSPLNNPNFNDAIALTWLYLVVVGLLIMRYDRGSKVNELLAQS